MFNVGQAYIILKMKPCKSRSLLLHTDHIIQGCSLVRTPQLVLTNQEHDVSSPAYR